MALETPFYAVTSLGHTTPYPQTYDPALLLGLERHPGRQSLGLEGAGWPAHGGDLWTAYELSWLDAYGRPQVAVLRLHIGAHSPCIVESKSLKLYLCSLHEQRFSAPADLLACLQADLSACLRASPELQLCTIDDPDLQVQPASSFCIDQVAWSGATPTQPDAGVLRGDGAFVAENLVSHLFKSNCPVTGQPDWASVFIRYQGPRLDHGALLAYLLSFRHHADFHEHCVERIYLDLWRHMQLESLLVMARYTRRGGVDINPWRASHATSLTDLWPRLGRQ